MVERIQQWLKAMLERFIAWWGKFNAKQKTLIISVSAAVVVLIVIAVTILTQPKFKRLHVSETAKETADIQTLLDENTITYRTSEDGLVLSVLEEQYTDAVILLGANNIPAVGADISNVFEGGFSTTEADKTKKYTAYLQQYIADTLAGQDNINQATVTLNIPDNDGTLIREDKESYASVMLYLDNPEDMDEEQAAGLARFVATSIGNDTTNNIVIMDSRGNMLYSGEDETSVTGGASNRLSYKAKYDGLVKAEIRDALVGAKIYDNVQVMPNLDLNWDQIKKTEHTYTPADGQDQGVLSHRDTYSQVAQNSNGDIPGTDTNGEITYEFQDSAYSNTTTDEESTDYLPNETITDTQSTGGVIRYDTSSIGITAIHYVVYNEDDLKTQGLLDGINFEEYRLANSERVKQEVDEDVYSVVSRATGIPVANIQIIAYDEPVFVESETSSLLESNVLLIALVILILALLAFVVIRSMRAEKQPEVEEEIPLDDMLQSTTEVSTVGELDSETKSEMRIMIEKFVDENPDAVANLLRNWLQEDWG
ncbi:MAG: flagellar M-ring protein FliF [Lachnospiraceae bacterium]|nr:flagellar M-ring protein FliF [Lachnospiraceae bacterium]